MAASPQVSIGVECGSVTKIEDILPFVDEVYQVRVEKGKIIWDKVKGEW